MAGVTPVSLCWRCGEPIPGLTPTTGLVDECAACTGRGGWVRVADKTWKGPAGRLEIPMELIPADPEDARRFAAELETHLADPLPPGAERMSIWTRWFPDGDAISRLDDPTP